MVRLVFGFLSCFLDILYYPKILLIVVFFLPQRYEIASGDGYFRRGDLERSLKNYLDVVKHYTRIVEDHFKFHSYHSREMSVRAYVETLKNRERLDPGLYFHKAVSGVVRLNCYMLSSLIISQLSSFFCSSCAEKRCGLVRIVV